MKTITTVLAGLLVSTALFTSCSKDKYGVAAGNNNPSTAKPLAKLESTDFTVKFSSGAAVASYVGATTNEKVLFEARGLQKMGLLNAMADAGYKVPYGEFPNYKMVLYAQPMDA